MVRDRLCQEEHPEQHGVGFDNAGGNARNQRQHGISERFIVEAGRRIKASDGIQVVVA